MFRLSLLMAMSAAVLVGAMSADDAFASESCQPTGS